MGMSASADLVFGVDCGVEESPWADEEFAEGIEDNGDLEEGLLKQAGLANSREIVDACPFEIVYYGSHEFSSYIIYVKGFSVSGSWEGPTTVEADKLVPPSDDVLKACAEYAEEHGIKWGEPAWLISASWG